MDPDARATDLLVIGGGTAGLLAARTAASLGASVVLVDRAAAPGGDCLWTGCVPSKTLINCADEVAVARRSLLLHGIGRDATVDVPAVWDRVRAAIATIAPDDSADSLVAAGVRVVAGDARFTGPRTVVAAGREIGFSQAVIAVGAGPAPTSFPVHDPGAVLTTDTVWHLSELPRRLVVVGGGSGGCELAQAFARLGSEVTLVEAADRLLPGEDERAGRIVAEAMVADGVRVCTGFRATRVEAGSVLLDRVAGGTDAAPAPDRMRPTDRVLPADRVLPTDRVLLVQGRRPRTADLGVAAAGVGLDADGHVRVDATLRTDNPRVWAAGDVTGRPHLTHRAGVHGSVVAANAVLGLRRTVHDAGLPRVTFTRPEVAAVGVSAAKAARRPGWRVLDLDHTHLDRAVTDDTGPGLTSLVLDRRGRVRGGLVIGPRAGETVGEIALAVAEQVTASRLTGVTHPYPTFNDGLWNLAVAEYRRRLGTGANRRVLPALRWMRNRRLSG